MASPAVIAELRAVRDLLSDLETKLLSQSGSQGSKAVQHDLAAEAIVDQRSAPVPRDLYLRLARAGAFPSNKIGKRVCARWQDVQAAFLGHRGAHDAAASKVANPPDGLDILRLQLGLAPKGN